MTKYHLEPVKELPVAYDGRKDSNRQSKLEKILSHIAATQPGEWFLVGTYSARYGGAAALKNLRDKVSQEAFAWDGQSVPFKDEQDKVRSRLYLRVDRD